MAAQSPSNGRVPALAAALLVHGFGEELWSRFVPAYLRTLGASALTLGAYGTLRDLLDAAYAYPGGALADRLGASRALLLFGALSVAGIGCYLAWPSVPGIFLGLFLVMGWKSMGLPATFAVIAEDLRESGRLVGFSVQAVVKRIPVVVAPPLGGLLLQRLGMSDGLRVGLSISLVLSTGMLLGLRRAVRRRPAAIVPRQSERGGKVRLHPALRQLLVADCLIRLCEGLPDVFLVVWAIEIVRVSPAQFGLLASVLVGTSILSYVPAALLAGRTERKPFVVLTYFFFTLYPLAVFLSHSFVVLAGASVIGGLREIGEPARKALIVDLAEESARGRTVGLYYTLRGVAVAGAAAFGGVLWSVDPSLTFLTATALGAIGTVWAAAFLPATPRQAASSRSR